MKRPDIATMVITHPLIFVPLTLASGFSLYIAWQTGNTGLGLIAAVILARLGAASEKAHAYRMWVKAWNAMAPEAPPRQPVRWGQLAILAIGFGLLAAALLYPDAMRSLAPRLGPLAAAAILVIALWVLVRWAIRRRCSKGKPFTVAVVARPALPLPKLANIYRALPSHCDAILRRRG